MKERSFFGGSRRRVVRFGFVFFGFACSWTDILATASISLYLLYIFAYVSLGLLDVIFSLSLVDLCLDLLSLPLPLFHHEGITKKKKARHPPPSYNLLYCIGLKLNRNTEAADTTRTNETKRDDAKERKKSGMEKKKRAQAPSSSTHPAVQISTKTKPLPPSSPPVR